MTTKEKPLPIVRDRQNGDTMSDDRPLPVLERLLTAILAAEAAAAVAATTTATITNDQETPTHPQPSRRPRWQTTGKYRAFRREKVLRQESKSEF